MKNMATITDISGVSQEISCIACGIQSGSVNLPVERIAETEHFFLEQDFEWPIEGFLIVASKRHVFCLDELNEKETEECFDLVRKARKTLREVIGTEYITLVLHEKTPTSHFHAWIFPWHAWMFEKFSGKPHEVLDVMKFAKEHFSDEEHLKVIRTTAEKIQRALSS